MRLGSEQMMQAPSLGLGSRLEIGLGETEGALSWYASRLEDASADGERLVVAWPTDRQRQLVPLDAGAPIQVAVTAQDALYVVCAVIVEAGPRGPLPLVTVRLDGSWQRAQRRSDVRLGVAIKPRLAARLAGAARQPLRAGIVNISAGGVQLRSQDTLSAGDRVELAFELLGIAGELQVTARVQRVERQDRGSLPVWEAGCVFEELADRTAQRIVQFIFAQQCALARARRRSA